MLLAIGSKVIYPSHGPCIISSIVNKVAGEQPMTFYQLLVLNDGRGTLLVPVDKAKSIGIRPLLTKPQIAKLLGESLRQCFQESGLPDTARALDQSCSEMNSVQKQLVNVLREVAHPDIGVIAKVRSANDSLVRSMTTRAQQMDDFLVALERQVWAIWLPVVASAALALGFALGTWFADMRQGTPEVPTAAQSQQTLMPESPPQQVVPQRHAKHR